MKVYVSKLTLEGAALDGENPLPIFRDRNHHKKVVEDGTLKPEQKQYLGNETGERILPYRIQDRYSRDRKPMVLKTILIENDILQAVFLPDYGGRLYSLKDKRTGREILYKNPVFQPANLAILNAWFSGGIEWNVGQVGHTFTTCSPVHAAKLRDEDGNEFLRIFEYERCKNVFWHLDFHLPKGSDKLFVYVRIINDNNKPVPMYWWTNIAVEETPRARVFSSTSDVIYMDQVLKGFGAAEMPDLPTVPGVDASYPMKIPFASEYFFQTPEHVKSPWEAVAYEDGKLFYERSTPLLRYRKMFCWGNHTGGRRWCDFLSRPGEGNYIEVQGGLAPTQIHGMEMPANTTWDFTQIIGMSDVNTELSHQDSWDNACNYINGHVDKCICEAEVFKIHRQLQATASRVPEEVLNVGSGWGALERSRREKKEGRKIPLGFTFSDNSLGACQHPWLILLREGHLPDSDVKDIPLSWMVQDEWMNLIEESLENKECQSWDTYMHYGVMLYENGIEEKAVDVWERSLEIKPSSWVYRNLAQTMKLKGENEKALCLMEKAFMVSDRFPDKAFAEEYLSLLILYCQYDKAWNIYESLPSHFRGSDRIRIIMGAAALELGKEEFLEQLFDTEFAVIREGEVLVLELWYKYNAMKFAEENNVKLTDELLLEVKKKYQPPRNLDFRIINP